MGVIWSLTYYWFWRREVRVPEMIEDRNLPHSESASETFAYVICVDNYKSPGIRDLHGSKNDGDNIVKYLRRKLLIPDSHITRLDNEAATSSGIVSLLKEASSNPSIQKDNLIVFFFAGHGGRSKGLKGWKTDDGLIETICPHDIETCDNAGKKVYGIPDFVVASHLGRLAARGANVVSIFDSCHSGGIGRDTNGYLLEPRSALCTDIPGPELEVLFSEYPEARDFSNQAQGSRSSPFTLLAACGKREVAHEGCSPNGLWGGSFTNALIEALDTLPLDESSYATLYKSLHKLPYQNPEFVGATNRIIFTLAEVKEDGLYFDISAREDGRYTVQKAGIALGIGPGTRFEVLARNFQALGSLIVEDVETFQCHARAELEKADPGGIPDSARAVLRDWSPYDGPLRVALGHGVGAPPSTSDNAARFRVVEDANADVVISMREINMEIQRRDPLIPAATGVPTITFPSKTDASSVEGILTGIAHFNHHLFRESHSSLGETVTVELYRLKRGMDRRFRPENPDKPTNLLVNNSVDVRFPPKAPYGMLIKNSSPYALYPYLFYFNPSRYSIVPVYMSPESPNAPLPASGEFPIGYGESSERPLSFTLSDGQSVDVGFFRLFLSETYVEMGAIKQQPFSDAIKRHFEPWNEAAWDARTIIVRVDRNNGTRG